MSIVKVTLFLILITIIGLDTLITKSSFLFFLPIPETVTIILSVNIISVFCFFIINSCHQIKRVAIISALLAMLVFPLFLFIFMEILALIDIKGVMAYTPPILILFILIFSAFRIKHNGCFDFTIRNGIVVIVSSILVGIMLFFISYSLNLYHSRVQVLYYSVLYLGLLFSFTIPLVIEYKIAIIALRQKSVFISIMTCLGIVITNICYIIFLRL